MINDRTSRFSTQPEREITSVQKSQRKIYDIPGGIHPPERKAQSLQLPLADAQMPSQVVLPLSQHIGAPAEPVVAVGDSVKTGQVVARANGIFSVPVHASISGTVSAIEERPIPHASNLPGLCIVIDSDGQDNWVELEPCDDYTALEHSDLVEKIRNAGVAGLGGAGFPTAVKLNPRSDQQIETLILNGTECEPYITADDTLMREKAAQVVEGAKLLAHLLGNPGEVIIGVEDNKPTAIDCLRRAAQGTDVEIASFPTKYPSGGEKQLIQILTGKEVPSGAIPASLGIVVQNVGTAVAAYEAVRFGTPLVSRITTVVGEALETQGNIQVRFGTLISDVLANNGFSAEDCARLIMGGPMMGFALQDPDVPVVKTTNCILAPSPTELPEAPPQQACIRCGHCAEACPASLLPQQLYWYSQAEDHEKLEAHNIMDCIECGACSFVCPSNIPLVQYYRASKGAIKQAAIDKEKSDRSRQRFEFRQARIAKAEAEKEAKRLARKQAAEKAKAQAAEKALAASQETAAPVATATIPAPEVDPAAEAAKEKAKLERNLSSAQNRLEKAQDRIIGADPERKPKLEARVKEAELKVTEAQKKLDAFNETAQGGDSIDAIINRAKAKTALPPREKLETNIESLKTRIAKAEEKLAAAKAEGANTVEALQTGLEKIQSKLAQAQEELAKLPPDEKPAAPAQPDAASAAIERAKAKAQALAAMSPEDKLRDQIESMQKRIGKAQQKVEQAKAENSDSADALQMGFDKMTAKLDNAKAEWTDLTGKPWQEAAPKSEPLPEQTKPLDPATAAIEKAKAKASALAAMSPEDKLRDQIESMQTRIAKAQNKLETAKAEGADTLDALQMGFDKMTTKLDKAKADWAELTGNKWQETATSEAAIQTTETQAAETQIAAKTAEPLDPAAAAIEKAKAKAEALAAMSPADKLRDQIASMETRIAKAFEKLEKAKSEGSDTADALQMGFDKMTAKLEKAKADLAELK